MRFSDFVTLQRGFDLPKTEMREGPYPVLGSTSVIGHHSEFKIEPPGVVTGRSGSLGVVQFVRDRYWPHNTALWVKDFKGNDPRFVYYSMQGLDFARFNAGAGVPTLNRNHLDSLEVNVPPLPIQRRIAGILNAYDELIENSQRRIKILEAMARALYREWFVHFRFPGHESVPRVPSPLGEIPEGWEVREMQEVAEVIDCLHSKKPSSHPDGVGLLLQLNNIGEGGKLDLRELYRISADDYRLWTSRIELSPGDCVVTNVGRVGAVAQIPERVHGAPGRNMTAIRVRPGKLTPTFLIEYLLSSQMTSEVARNKDLGTIMDSLNVKGIVRLQLPYPPFAVMKHFEGVARPIRKDIELLVEQIANLRRTRDLLLPRLLSGQIDVEALDHA